MTNLINYLIFPGRLRHRIADVMRDIVEGSSTFFTALICALAVEQFLEWRNAYEEQQY